MLVCGVARLFYLLVGTVLGWGLLPGEEENPSLSHSRFASPCGFEGHCGHQLWPEAWPVGPSLPLTAASFLLLSPPAPHGSLVSRKERKRPALLTCEFQVVHCNAGRPLSSTGGVLQNPGARQPGGGTLGSVPLSSCGGQSYAGLGQVAEGEAKFRPVTGVRALGGGALSGALPDSSLINISTVAFSG